MTLYQIGERIEFRARAGKLAGQKGTVVDVRHEGHHVRVALESGRTVSTRPGSIRAIKEGE